VLYDYICTRNKEIVRDNGTEINLRKYLYGDFTVIRDTLGMIKKVYTNYSKEVIDYKYTKFKADKILLKSLPSKRLSKKFSISSKRGSQYFAQGLFGSNGPRMSLAKSFKSEESEFGGDNQEKNNGEYNFNIVKLNTRGPHTFFNLNIGDEGNTNKFTEIKTRVVFYLIIQVIISNWHYVCYIGFTLYCFFSGGASGFLYIIFLITFVLIEETYPSLIFWRLSFANTCISMLFKIIFIEILFISDPTGVLAKSASWQNQTLSIMTQLIYLIFGFTSYKIDSLLLICILIQMILLDEIGLKEHKPSSIEDTSSAYVRMRLNKIFELNDRSEFRTYELYLRALYNAVTEEEPLSKENHTFERRTAIIKDSSSKLKRLPTMNEKLDSQKSSHANDSDKINLNDVIAYQKEIQLKKYKEFHSAALKVDVIFMRSFSMFNKKNMSSFRWQNFSVYSRKPGIDLSILINAVLLGLLFYCLSFANEIVGDTNSIASQIQTSVILKEAIMMLIACLGLLVIERGIYKRNPKAWRKNLQIEKVVKEKPQNIQQLRDSIEECVENKTSLDKITWDHIYVSEKVDDKMDTKEKLRVEDGTSKDLSYTSNPLYLRYHYQITLVIIATLITWIVFPLTKNLRKYGSVFCRFTEKNYKSPSTDCNFFQNDIYTQGLFALFLLYLVLSSLQIRLGEPINKGKTALMSRYNMLYYNINIALKAIPFFFSIATMIDFLLTPTSLEFWDWMKFESIYQTLYIDINKMQKRDQRIPGLKIGSAQKIIYGIGMSLFQLLVLLFPLIAFGNFVASTDTIINASVNLDLSIGTKSFNLYKQNYFKNSETIGNN